MPSFPSNITKGRLSTTSWRQVESSTELKAWDTRLRHQQERLTTQEREQEERVAAQFERGAQLTQARPNPNDFLIFEDDFFEDDFFSNPNDQSSNKKTISLRLTSSPHSASPSKPNCVPVSASSRS